MPAHRHPAALYLSLETSEEAEAAARGGKRGLATVLTFLLLAAAPVSLAFIALDGTEPAYAARGVAASDADDADDADDDDDVEGNAASNSGASNADSISRASVSRASVSANSNSANSVSRDSNNDSSADSGPAGWLTPSELSRIRELDGLRNGAGPASAGREAELVTLLTEQRKRIWRAAKESGWERADRRKRYESILARTR